MENGKFGFFQNFFTFGAVGLQAFTENGLTYFAVANRHDSSRTTGNVKSAVYKWSGARFELHQTIPTHGTQDVHVWRIDRFLFLAFADNYDTTTKVPGSIQIFICGGLVDLNCFSPIPTRYVLEMHSFLVCVRKMLAITEGSNITVYEMSGAMFRKYQSVTPSGVNRITTFEHGGKTFLMASSIRGGENTIYQWMA